MKKDRLLNFIESANAFEVMGVLKREGILTKEDLAHAMTLDRQGWLKFIKEKAGITEEE